MIGYIYFRPGTIAALSIDTIFTVKDSSLSSPPV